MTPGQSPFSKPLPTTAPGPGAGELAAVGAGLGWAGVGGALWWFLPGVIGPLGLLLPMLLLAAAFFQARQLRMARQEAEALRRSLNDLRRKHQSETDTPEARAFAEPAGLLAMPLLQRRPAPPVAEPEDSQATFASRRGNGMAGLPKPEVQGHLDLGAAEEDTPPLEAQDFLTALNFPQDPEDLDGFRALRLALAHAGAAPVILAAQDVLTLMSQFGLYMDDLAPDRARPELWRRFAQGERDAAMGDLGGIRDADALVACARAMREDPVFRDAAHHFLRRFDLMLSARLEELDDMAIIRLADTRSARAFMLLGRTAGIFD